jgi:hypothetical protein
MYSRRGGKAVLLPFTRRPVIDLLVASLITQGFISIEVDASVVSVPADKTLPMLQQMLGGHNRSLTSKGRVLRTLSDPLPPSSQAMGAAPEPTPMN